MIPQKAEPFGFLDRFHFLIMEEKSTKGVPSGWVRRRKSHFGLQSEPKRDHSYTFDPQGKYMGLSKITLKISIVLILTGVSILGCSKKDSKDGLDPGMALLLIGALNNNGCVASSSADVATTTTSTGNFPVVDTNQGNCYNSSTGAVASCSGNGYDADYTGNSPSYAVSSDNQTITDQVTGLMWTSTADLNGDGLINISDKRTQCDAVSYCESLVAGGYEDWRLPDIKALYSLMDFTGRDPSVYSGTDTSSLSVFLPSVFQRAFGDTSAGDRIIDSQFATTSIYVSYTNLGGSENQTMFGVNFVDGRIKGYPVAFKSFYVQCVRGNTSYGLNHFVDNGNGTVSDNGTGLMWDQNDSSSTGFDNAVSICEDSTTAGYSDWRLPNVKELQSLVDYTRSPDTTGSAAINSVFNATAITNEGGKSDFGAYWSSTTHLQGGENGTDENGNLAAYVCFGRCLGYTSGAVQDVHGAGAQRSDYKPELSTVSEVTQADVGYGTFYFHGPQGDIQRNGNMVRCVRTP